MPSYSKSVKLPGKSADELYEKVAAGIERFISKTPIGDHEIQNLPEKKQVILKSKMANLTLKCSEGKLELDGSLSFMALPFRGKLDEGIDRWIQKMFA